MESKKINQLATELAPVTSDLTVIGDPITGELKKITFLQVASIIGSGASLNLNDVTTNGNTTGNSITIGGLTITGYDGVLKASAGVVGTYPYGGANGVATLDSAGKVPVSQLPSSIMEYKGTWNATTNTPTLANGTGDNGDVYRVSVGGTINLGGGAITFDVGDYVIYNGTIWEKSDTTDSVASVFGRTGVVTAQEGDYSLDLLSDVTITSPLANHYLKYNGTAWVNELFPSFLSSDKLLVPVRNNSGATITKGSVVYINGAVGNKATIALALANADATSAQTLGLVQDDIVNNAEGFVVANGECFNLNTSAYTEGTQLYLSPTTAGTYTSVKQYAPNHLVYVGVVVRSHINLGVILVKVQNGYELDEIHNVSAQTPTNNDGLFWEASTSLWKNKSIATILGFTPISLASLSASSPLLYNNTTGVFSIQVANTTQNGYLSNTDWNTFNGKMNNPLTSLGDMVYSNASGAPLRLAGNITATKQFLSQTGTGTASAIPVWSAVTKADVGLANVENTALSTWAGSTNITTLGTITSGTWNATTIAIARGGTGLTSLGTGLQLLRVNAGATALEYFTPTYISLTGLSATSPLLYNNTTGVFSIQQANTTQSGFLSNTDWNTFNGKQSAITLTTTGSSGASTFVTNTLNIPTYTLAGLGGQPLNTNLTSLGGLTFTSTAFVKMTGANTFALDTNTYLTANQTITLTGNVTGSGTTSIATTIANNVVTNAMLSQVATATFKGRTTAGTGNVEDLSVTQATALLNIFTTTLKGLVPASGGGTTNFLRADGTWSAPAGTGFTNPMTTLGDTLYQGASQVDRLAGNITTAKQYLSQTGTGTISSAPAWSSIAGADVTGSALTETDDTNVTMTLGGTPATALLRSVSMTLGWTGQLAVSRGGSGASTLTGILVGNGTSAFTGVTGTASQLLRRNAGNTAYEFFTIAGSDITGSALTSTNDTNIQITIGGTPATSLLRAVSLTMGWTGQLAIGRGGTGLGTIGTANQLLRVNAGATALEYFTPTYLTSNQTITLSGDVTGSGATAITTTIANNVVTLAKFQQIATSSFLGRVTAATGNAEVLTSTQATSLLNTFTSTLKGLAPASGGGTTTFLRADGTWATPAGSGLTGSGNVNYIPKWATSTSLGDSQIFDSGTNVGVGTIIPEAKLHVNDSTGDTRFTIGQTGTNAKQTLFIQKTTGSGYLSIQAVHQAVNYTPIVLNEAGGNVGIGINPLTKLHVNGVGEILRLQGTGSGNNYIGFRNDTTDLGFLGYGATSNGMYVANYLDAPIYFLTNSLTRLTILNSGDVGIGITPSHKLDVAGNIGINGVLFASRIGNYTYLYEGGAISPIGFGNASVPVNVYNADTHYFYNRNQSIGYFTSTSSGTTFYHKLTAGTQSSTNGSIILDDIYSNGHLTTFGTNRSDGAPVIGFAVSPSTTTTNQFLGATTLELYPRGALIVGNTLRYYSGAVQTVTIGNTASLTKYFEIKDNGQMVLPAYTTTGSFSGTAVGYLAFDSSGNIITTTGTGGGGGGFTYSYTSVTSVYTETATSGYKIILADTTSGAFTINLPTAVGNTALIVVKKIAGTGALTIDASGTQTIDGSLTATISVNNTSLSFISNNSNWLII